MRLVYPSMTVRTHPHTRPPVLSRLPLLAVLAAILMYAAILTHRAWLGDDAYITFRTIDNWMHGFPLAWNVSERVQSYTHPLWMFLVSLCYALTHEFYFTVIGVSIGLSTLAAGLYSFKIAPRLLAALPGLVILSLSNAYVDYSTSGLENPLSHLLLVVFFILFFKLPKDRRGLWALSLTASLLILNRQDLCLLILPPLVYLAVRGGWRSLPPLIAGQVPTLVWELFSLFYYGFLFPNTAYAKLNTGIPTLELLQQGLYYFQNSLRHDPLTLAAILAACILAVLSRKPEHRVVALGAILYLAYVLKIGGDFMSGRFLAAPLLVAVILIARADLGALPRPVLYTAGGLVLLLGLAAPLPTYRTLTLEIQRDPQSSTRDSHGISDERLYYSLATGLMRARSHPDLPEHPWRELGEKYHDEPGYAVVVGEAVGFLGYFAGPQVHIIDQLALCDPLLARLPAEQADGWRIGHFARAIPPGYIESIETGSNQIVDPHLASYYDQLKLITQGKLTDPERLKAIWEINTGQYDWLLPQSLGQSSPTLSVHGVSTLP
ncbi:MAG: hypothetical protein GYA17_07120 [Chloroflexi bacterium]|nr:hypothetical protein [Chloroflexota bacterium]